MIRTAAAALLAASLAAPALAAQGICEFVVDRGVAPLPAPAALLDVERLRETLAAMPSDPGEEDAFAALTVVFDRAGRFEDLEVFLRPGVAGDAEAVRAAAQGALLGRPSGPRSATAVMLLTRGAEAAVDAVPIRQECLPRMINEGAVREEIQRSIERWATPGHRGSRTIVNTQATARFRVDEHGRMGRARLVRRTNAPEIDIRFLRAIERGVFEPGSVDGIPIGRWVEYPLSVFALR